MKEVPFRTEGIASHLRDAGVEGAVQKPDGDIAAVFSEPPKGTGGDEDSAVWWLQQFLDRLSAPQASAAEDEAAAGEDAAAKTVQKRDQRNDQRFRLLFPAASFSILGQIKDTFGVQHSPDARLRLCVAEFVALGSDGKLRTRRADVILDVIEGGNVYVYHFECETDPSWKKLPQRMREYWHSICLTLCSRSADPALARIIPRSAILCLHYSKKMPDNMELELAYSSDGPTEDTKQVPIIKAGAFSADELVRGQRTFLYPYFPFYFVNGGNTVKKALNDPKAKTEMLAGFRKIADSLDALQKAQTMDAQEYDVLTNVLLDNVADVFAGHQDVIQEVENMFVETNAGERWMTSRERETAERAATNMIEVFLDMGLADSKVLDSVMKAKLLPEKDVRALLATVKAKRMQLVV